MNIIISRDEAIAQGRKRFFTGKPCKRGHVAEKMVSSYACVECNREAAKRKSSEKAELRLRLNYQQHKPKDNT